jgi:hypothetical protein
MKMLGNFNAKVGIDEILNQNDSLYKINNDNAVRIVNFPTSKNLITKSKMFPHHNKIRLCPNR